MIHSRIIPITLAFMALVFSAVAQEEQPDEAEKAAQAQTDSYVAAFNKGDAEALAAMYSEDAQYSNEDGTVISGREDIARNLEDFFAENKGAELDVQIESARFLTSDVLIEKGLASVGDETTRYVCNYVKKDGNWLISDLSETTLPPSDAAAAALEDLGWMVGNWKDASPDVKVTTTVDWTKNHHFLRRSISINRDEDEGPMEATEVIGYDPVSEGIRSWVFDSEGGFGEGTWSREGNKWLVSFKATAPDGTTSSAQHIITYVDDNKFLWESINRQSEGEALPNIDKIEVVRAETE